MFTDSKTHEYPEHTADINNQEISIAKLIKIISAYKYLIIAFAILGIIVSGIKVYRAVPLYKAQALIMPAIDNSNKGGLSSLASQFGDLASLAGADLGAGNSGKNEAIALLRSRVFTEEFIKEKNLLQELYSAQWDAINKRWKTNNEKDIPTLWHAYEFFDKKIRFIDEDKKTGLVTLSIQWTNRKKVAEWADELVKRLNYKTRERTIAEAKKSLTYLNKELTKNSSVDLQQVIYRLIENQIKTIMLANVRDEYAFKIIDPPAVPPENATINPKRSLILGLGVTIGIILGLIAALTHYIWFSKNSGKTA